VDPTHQCSSSAFALAVPLTRLSNDVFPIATKELGIYNEPVIESAMQHGTAHQIGNITAMRVNSIQTMT